MSFLSSHRLHWGVHHELSDNFWGHLEKMVHDAAHVALSSTDAPPEPSPVNTTPAGQLASPHSRPSPEALGP